MVLEAFKLADADADATETVALEELDVKFSIIPAPLPMRFL